MNKDIIFLVGPTATGKTEVSIALAEMLDAEIISCDSMQVYKEISILSAKPPKEYLEKVPHYLVDVISVEEDYDVYKFYTQTQEKIKDILSRGKKVICVGGSGMYFSILLDGIFNFSYKDEDLREQIRIEGCDKGGYYLHEELKKVDPESAERIHPNDLKRIVRALEVYRLSGKSLTQLKSERKGIWSEYKVRVFGLLTSRPLMYEKINHRVDEMFEAGAVDEIKGILDKNLSRTFKQIIGYSQIKAHIEEEVSLDEAKEEIKTHTRRFAKRQLTWYRKDKRVSWVRVDQFKNSLEVAQYINKRLTK